ncbi:hypothetical protein ABD91_20945 [Lysinibacillus sphaericus]|nr:hypothetical protein [Lysinibacillus sphaericus]
MNLQKMGKGFTYDPELKRVTYSMKEYIRSKHSFNKGHVDQYLIIYLMATNIHFYVNGEEDLENFLFLDHEIVEHEEIQERLYTNYTLNMEVIEKTIVRDIQEGISRYVLTDEKYEELKDEQKTQIIEYITFHQE